MRVVHVKDCDCQATASTNQIRTSQRYDPETCSHKVTVTHYPWPSCDECGKPWKPEETTPPRTGGQ